MTGASLLLGFAINRSSSKKCPVAPSARKYVNGGRGVTVSTKVVEVVVTPSLTVTVIVVWPLCSGSGVIVTVRLAPLPPNAMAVSGTSA